ncbi:MULTISPECIES: GNAT family N-acetyltransferase [Niastella]|uniref:GNAT family N-acetyltransferase n=1 Tax=Niastella soli TaxID=2821487 RepID=A0ABS3YT22_9BACT|nr:GNAT family N-acetyltransferase [Niastella soli]MBO9201035.1 GNAT family N-acetyltransferase [Niastella soli]
MPNIQLRTTTHSDLEHFFLFQLDEEACHLAAFMPKDHDNKEVFMQKYDRILNDENISIRTILVDDVIAGSVSKFIMFGDAEITYWIDKPYWGKGVAATALKQFLTIENTRPIFGRVAFDNIGSQRVLEKCGFVKIATDHGFASARATEIEEYVYKLSS